MKNIALIAISGLACHAASAGTYGITLIFDADGDPYQESILSPGSHTWTVYASFTSVGSDGYFGGFVGSFLSTGVGSVSNWTTLMGGNATTPIAEGGDWTNINIFNSALLGTDDPLNPIAIATFDSELVYGFEFTGVDGTASLFPDGGIFTLPLTVGPPGISVLSDYQIPAPGALTALGLGGVIASRRRR